MTKENDIMYPAVGIVSFLNSAPTVSAESYLASTILHAITAVLCHSLFS